MTSHRGVGAVPAEVTMHEEADNVEDISGIDDVIELVDAPAVLTEVINPDLEDGQTDFGQRVKSRVSVRLESTFKSLKQAQHEEGHCPLDSLMDSFFPIAIRYLSIFA